MPSGDELFAWQVQEPDGQWSMVGASFWPDNPECQMPLIHRNRNVINRMRSIAKAHAEATDQPLRLVKFVLHEVLTP